MRNIEKQRAKRESSERERRREKRDFWKKIDVGHNLLFNYCKLLFMVFLCKKTLF